ncbi:hypothetical protein ACIBHY_42170 [Nonomuraea sp. NPDC050547]|uniref:hypothetical protein n=1 Tax=unclassified Nonomuraea TaxID=2593643 RepID=UPI0034922EC4
MAQAENAAKALEALVRRLGDDDTFAAALKESPRQTLADAGLTLEKESMEALMLVDPARFDLVSEALFDLVDSDFLVAMGVPSCG